MTNTLCLIPSRSIKYFTVVIIALLLSLPITVIGNQHNPLEVIISDETGAVIELGSIVSVRGNVEQQMIRCTSLLVDRTEVASKPGNGRYVLNWDTHSATPGVHYLEVAAVGGNGGKKIVSRADVKVIQEQPVSISIPSAINFGTPQKIPITLAYGYTPIRALLYVDGVAAQQPVSIKDNCLEWDAGEISAGSHKLEVFTWDVDDIIARSYPILVTIPERLIVKSPDSAAITEQVPNITLELTIPERLPVKKLSACCDGKLVIELDSRCGTIDIPALELESGKHDISIELLDANGGVYKWGPQSVTVDNRYKAAVAAKAEAEKTAKEAAEKAENDRIEAERAKQEAEDAASEKAKEKQKKVNAWVNAAGYRDAAKQDSIDQACSRSRLSNSGGTVGKVRGLCVRSIGGIFEFGNICSISAKVTEGHSSVTVNASDVDDDFMDSITNARKFIMAYVARAGYKVDWTRTNIDLHYQRNGPKGGDSAGAAMATAIISSLLKVPVRNEVVVTGAIKPDGTIESVGGVDLKATAAFSDPSVLTIIIPRFSDDVADVLSLPPKLLVGHRLIAADNMDQVLRQALVGYDQGTLAAASQLFSQGLALYGNGKTSEAIAKLMQAQSLTPEDLTIPVWINVMKRGQ